MICSAADDFSGGAFLSMMDKARLFMAVFRDNQHGGLCLSAIIDTCLLCGNN